MSLSTVAAVPAPPGAPLKATSLAVKDLGPAAAPASKRRPRTFLRELTLADYKPAAASLAESFAHDDVARYLVDTPARADWSESQKYALHLRIMEAIVQQHLLRGLVTAAGPASDPYACIALWMPPGADGDDWACTLRSGLWRLRYRLCAEGRARLYREFWPLLHRVKHEVLGARDADAYYLVYIGTRPRAQGLGLCRTSVEHVTARADDEGRACYLESSNDANPAIYARLGFAHVRRIELTRGLRRVPLDVMVREPVDGGAASSVPSTVSNSAASDGDVCVLQALNGRKMKGGD